MRPATGQRARLPPSGLHLSQRDYTGRVTVPVLLDKQRRKDRQQRILRDHPDAQLRVRRLRGRTGLLPVPLRSEIDAINPRSTRTSTTASTRRGSRPRKRPTRRPSRAVRDAGRAGEAALSQEISGRRAHHRGGLAALHDAGALRPVYVGHFKCNLRRLIDYRNLWAYTRDSINPGSRRDREFDHIKRHYYMSHRASIRPASCPRGRRWTGTSRTAAIETARSRSRRRRSRLCRCRRLPSHDRPAGRRLHGRIGHATRAACPHTPRADHEPSFRAADPRSQRNRR